MVVEIQVPLLPTPGLPDGSYLFPWIEEVEDFLADLENKGDVEIFDDGEEDGTSTEHLLAVASRVATLTGVPAGSVAVVSNDEAKEFGLGQRVPLPLPAR